MVFPFFRKGKDEDEPSLKAPVPKRPAGRAPEPAVPQAPPAPEKTSPEHEFDDHLGTDFGIEVVETTGEISSVVEEAAIFYANERPNEAATCLLQHIRDNPTTGQIQPWLMLFDLYQLRADRKAFDELAMDFVVKFERSPPVWVGREPAARPQPAPAPQKGSGYFAFTGNVTESGAEQFEQLQDMLAKQAPIRLDLSKIQDIDAAASARLVALLQQMRKNKAAVQYIGATGFGNLLSQSLESQHAGSKPHWLLLLELHQILGKQDEFEELAIQYAITFEESPPSWEGGAAPADVQEPEPSPEPVAAGEGEHGVFHMRGVISGSSDAVLQSLEAFAAAQDEVVIDMMDVSRVDFVCVGNFLNVLIKLSTAGKSITIRGANEMVLALFAVMGVDQFATLTRAVRR